ncbi:hypothetical protein [Polaromonas sp.]|uniref:hypothetical protein n=1 Tax=Polaromonas sp. TaxID=1869339 RepID=UPI00248A29FA|nr:hypothetical protein [Polaromonas sp.]MDI1338184.1 hypothetical protein [Polaromonas sp.]
MKHRYLLVLALAFLVTGASAAGNSGRSAMDCVSASRDKQDIVFRNSCDYKVFVVWCGEQKYTKKKCGDGPAGNSFYTHSNNIEASSSIRASGMQEYRYAACEGGIGFGKSEIRDSPDGSFQCVGAAAGKQASSTKAEAALPASAAHQRPLAQATPVGVWQVVTEAGERARLTLQGDGAASYADKYPARWSRQGDRITVIVYANDGAMQSGRSAMTYELEMTGSTMTGTKLATRINNQDFPALALTLSRLN